MIHNFIFLLFIMFNLNNSFHLKQIFRRKRIIQCSSSMATKSSDVRDKNDLDLNNHLIKTIQNAPKFPGIYRMKDHNNNILYIGKSVELFSRVRSYFKSSTLEPSNQLTRRIAFMTTLVHDIEYEITDSATDALILEANLIRLHQPPFNVLLKDDKRYPYVCITYSDEYPRIFLARHKRNDYNHKNRKNGYEDVYIGPFVDGAKIRNLIQVVKGIFPMQQRPSPLYKDKPCLNYHIGRCPGVCQGLISSEEYRNTITIAQKVIEGSGDDVINELEIKMLNLAKEERFEEAAYTQNMKNTLEDATRGNKLHFTNNFNLNNDNFQNIVDVIGVSSTSIKVVDNNENNNEVVEESKLEPEPEPELLCVLQLIKVRNGRITARLGVTQKLLTNEDPHEIGQIAQQFLEDHYKYSGSEPPNMILIPDQSKIVLPEIEMIKSIIQEKSNDNNNRDDDDDDEEETNIIEREREVKIKVVKKEYGENHLISYAQQLAKREASTLQSEYASRHAGLLQIAEMLEMDQIPSVIEAYDISHISGTNTAASVVVLKDGIPSKSDYHKVKISNMKNKKINSIGNDDEKEGHNYYNNNDDYNSLRTILKKRFFGKKSSKLAKTPFPDLILIDGGKGQLTSAASIIDQLQVDDLPQGRIPVLISLAKKEEQIFAIVKGEIVQMNKGYDISSQGMRLLRLARDEAHTTALNYHRLLRSQSSIK